jgi:NADPH:quinone reductase-like Zn-dependent oxidoreductase
MKAILLRRPGGPEALEYVEVPTPVPGEGKVLVKASSCCRAGRSIVASENPPSS